MYVSRLVCVCVFFGPFDLNDERFESGLDEHHSMMQMVVKNIPDILSVQVRISSRKCCILTIF